MLSYQKIQYLFKIFITFILCVFSAVALSQPHLTILDIENKQSLKVKSLHANIQLAGNTAITQLTYKIANNSEQTLTANIQLRLPQNAKVVSYSLDINGSMRTGVVVPKAKARHTFNTIQNRNVDPAIAEIIAGNQFQTEIYPVLAKQSRLITVEYIETLAINTNNQATYTLPLSDYDKGVDIEVEFTATGMPNPPSYTQLKRKYIRKGKRRYSSKIKTKNGLDDLNITYTLDKLSYQKLATAKDGQHYFSLNIPVNPQAFFRTSSPQKMDIYWDVSASMERHHAKNIKVIKHILQQYKKSLHEISLVIFAHDIIQEFKLSCVGNCEREVLQKLNSSFYDGATYLNSVSHKLQNSKADKALLFTDAINTIGTWKPSNYNVPTYVLSNQGKHNAIQQESLSLGSGGYVIHVSNTSLSNITKQLNRQLPNIDITFTQPDKVSDVFYKIQPKFNRLKVSGVIKDINNLLTINANKNKLIKINFNTITLADNDIAKHDWAIMALEDLQHDSQANKQKITQFGVKHKIVTPYTSLLVLERLEQYAEFNITPPKSIMNKENFKVRWNQAKKNYSKTPYDPDFALLIKQWEKRQVWWKLQKEISLEDAMQRLSKPKKKNKRNHLRPLLGAGNRVEMSLPPENIDDDHVEVIEVHGMSSTESRQRQAIRSRSPEQSQAAQLAPSALADNSMQRSVENEQRNPVSTSQHNVSINIAQWQPDASYIKKLEKAAPNKIISTYQTLKKTFGSLPVFYMDVAIWLHEKHKDKLAVRVLSNLAEMYPETPELMRMHAYNLMQIQRYQEAIMQLTIVEKILPYELTSYRDLANVWQLRALETQEAHAFNKAIHYYSEALNTYTKTDAKQALMILHELNRLIHIAKQKVDVQAINLPKALLVNLPLDLFISMQWNKDATDVDLWVSEPTGQVINFTKKEGVSGSYLPFDDTTGYGPEIYMNRFSLPGEYNIQAKLYNDRSTKLLGPNTISLSIYSHYGTNKETVKHTTLRLKEVKEIVDIGSFTVEAKSKK